MSTDNKPARLEAAGQNRTPEKSPLPSSKEAFEDLWQGYGRYFLDGREAADANPKEFLRHVYRIAHDDPTPLRDGLFTEDLLRIADPDVHYEMWIAEGRH